MNEGKVGRPYEYSDALVFWLLTAMTLFNSDYRCAVGFFGPVLEYMGCGSPPTRGSWRGATPWRRSTSWRTGAT